MADKKITDLQLRDTIDGSENLPVDDTIQTYRVTISQIKAWILSAGNVITATIADLAVTTAKLADSSVTSAKANFTAPTVQIFNSGSGTYTTPAGVKRIRVRMVGSGTSGGGSGTGVGGTKGNGGNNSTFGTSLLTAQGGGLPTDAALPGIPGGFVVNSPAIDMGSLKGGYGQGRNQTSTGSDYANGGMGGVTLFGGSGGGASPSSPTGLAGQDNTGAGGGGAASPSAGVGGSGGSSAGYVDAIINNPSSTYAYSVAASVSGGAAGTSGYVGGPSGSGKIIVEEYYQ